MRSKLCAKGSVKSVRSVRDKTPHELNSAQKVSVRSVSSVREKTSTKYASNPIGVTSHITPLPAGEGLGEGPLSYEFETVR